MFLIDVLSREPVYMQIINQLERFILIGIMKPNDQIPSVRSLSQELSINPNTIQKAFAVLEQQGFIYSVKGRGSFVSPDPGGGITQKRDEFYGQLKEMVNNAKDLKIGLADLQRKVEEYYGEARHD